MWALTSESALAERADRDKPINIESDSMISDEAKKISTFEGKVVLSQGSLIIRADRIVVRQDGDGFYYGVASGSASSSSPRPGCAATAGTIFAEISSRTMPGPNVLR